MGVLIVGAGAISRFHAGAVRKVFGSELPELSVADPNAAVLADFGTQFPEFRRFADAAEMLAQPAAPDDVVVIAAPPFVHADIAVAALESGRHVLCEKPLALDRAEAERMVETARRRRRILGCCSMRFVALGATQEVKRLIAAGAIGEPYHVTWINRHQRARSGIEYQPASRWFTDRSRNGGGVLQDWGPYDFSTLNEVLEPAAVHVLSAFCSSPETSVELPPDQVVDAEQHVGAALVYERRDGAPVAVTYERAACTHGEARSAVEIEGTDGALTWDWLDWQGPGNVHLTTDAAGRPVTETKVVPVDPQITGHDRPLLHLRDAIAGRPTVAVLNEQALFNFSCIRAIYDCAETGRPQQVTRDAEILRT